MWRTDGPDSVVIEGNTTFYTDSAGSKELTLTCQPSGAEPSSALTYSWNIACDVSNWKECTFRPRPPSFGNNGDVNRVITCTVTNTKNNNQRKQGSVTLNLKYPPPSPPQIIGYVNNSILYQGDNLTLTCSVTGGDPGVTSVTLTCPDQHENSTHLGQSSSLVIPSLGNNHNNLKCTCSGQWARPSYYTLTDSRTLRVYYPPSTPVIQRTDGSLLPYKENDNVTLTCTVTSPGNPEATLSWSDSRVINDRLQLTSVGKGDNLRNITCRAANAFTELKGRELLDVFTLRVYRE
ncbi:nephrin-like [Littorina saxatilis]|uniref:nephrin-like n=1 Tax=Littorina saxatilis TaxID=31220 RepID=UPI0038B46C6F